MDFGKAFPSNTKPVHQADLILVATIAIKVAERALEDVSYEHLDIRKRIDTQSIRQQILSQRLLMGEIHRSVDDEMKEPANRGLDQTRWISKSQERKLVKDVFNYLADVNDRYIFIDREDSRPDRPEIVYRWPIITSKSYGSSYRNHSTASSCDTIPPSCSEETWSSTVSVDLMDLTSVPPTRSFTVEHTPNDQSEQHGDQQEHNPSIDAGEQTVDTAGNRSCELI